MSLYVFYQSFLKLVAQFLFNAKSIVFFLMKLYWSRDIPTYEKRIANLIITNLPTTSFIHITSYN